MKNITSKVSKDDMDNARIDRNRTANPPDVEPGMDEWSWDDDPQTGSGGESSGGWGSSFGNSQPSDGGGGLFGPNGDGFGKPGGSTGFGGPFGQPGGFGGPFGGGGLFGGQQEKKESMEDKFWDALRKVGLGFFTFTGELLRSFKTFDVIARVKTGKAIMVSSILIAVVGLVLMLFGFGRVLGFELLVGSLISLGVGIPLFMFAYDDFLKNGAPSQPSEPEPFSDTNFGDFGDFGDNSAESFDEDDFSMFDDEDSDDFDSTDFSTNDLDFSLFDTPSETSKDDLERNMESILSTVDSNNGMMTRQYLYSNITNCLMEYNKNFDAVRVIREDSDEFNAWDAIVQNSAAILKTSKSEGDMPYLIEAKDKLFYTLLKIKRVSWIKNIDSFVAEIVNICRFDEDTGKTDNTIYGVGNTVGGNIFVKIMKGETAMVTVRDTYKNIEDFVKDSNNYMPIVLGLDEEGNVVHRDFKSIESILITGMPRSGKTWLVLSIIGQMMFYLKPSELHFYILDPKDQISDFKFIETPHIKKFVSDDNSILKELRHVVRVEGPRRKKLIGDAGFVNIWDYKKKNPDVDLPLLYVVIDEVITLAERMDKETKEEFQGLLLELVSQLPALGIRVFMIPHIVKDNILKKTLTDLIPCRISVKGDSDHIEKSVGAKNFKHRLNHQGDMAIRLGNDVPFFVHSAVLTTSNEGNKDLFDFLLKFWSKLEPESLQGSLHEKRQMEQKIKTNKNSEGHSITIEDNNSGNYSISRGKNKERLSKESVDDLLKGLNSDSDSGIELWDK